VYAVIDKKTIFIKKRYIVFHPVNRSIYLVKKTTKNIYCVLYDKPEIKIIKIPITFLLANILRTSMITASK